MCVDFWKICVVRRFQDDDAPTYREMSIRRLPPKGRALRKVLEQVKAWIWHLYRKGPDVYVSNLWLEASRFESSF
ncbi:hypothetical protein CFAM422_008796 [Trichoderma lentiforme]|uniref:Uncharacterized protein n=1 Tax=Trichoderma lentiforme TaxID=1567552 RepID=A0A9P4XA76_9HYPO|nr:hypothetical protein CFAM422_008796 [Trichoderma lentiforme]